MKVAAAAFGLSAEKMRAGRTQAPGDEKPIHPRTRTHAQFTKSQLKQTRDNLMRSATGK